MSSQDQKQSLKEKIQLYIDNYKWIFGRAKKHLGAIILYTILGFVGVVTSLFTSLASKDLVDIITGHRTGALVKTFAIMIAVQVITVVITNISQYINTFLSIKVENGLKEDLYVKIMSSDWEEISEYHSGNIISRWAGDSASISTGILTTFPSIFISLFRFISAFWLVIRYDWTFALFAVFSVPLSLLVSRKNMERFRKMNLESMEVTAQMSSFTQDSFSNMQNVKALDMIKLYIKRLSELQKKSADIKLKSQRVSMVNSLILVLVSQLVTYSTYGWGIYRVWAGFISYGTMTMFLGLSQSLSSTAQSLINIVPAMVRLSNSVQRIREISELPKEDYSRTEEVKAFFDANKHYGVGIRVESASFTYRSGTKVFENASFDASPREIVGLIGPSGEGKTTMLRLLLSIIRPKEGKAYITAGDAKTAKNDRVMELNASARQLFAYVPQGNTMFPGTIAENMRNVKEDATDDEIVEALKKACAWDFVSKLPEGINTVLKERGGGFSEGQAQRLSIARALIRRSPILLLDEATSALDMETERKLLQNIINDEYPRTCILTTHRPEVMNVCQRVYRIADGGMEQEC